MKRLEEVRQSVGKVLGAIYEGEEHITDKVTRAYNELDQLWNSPQFVHERNSFGKLALAMPRDYPGIQGDRHVYWDNFVEALDNMSVVRLKIQHNMENHLLLNVGSLKTNLDIMALHVEDIDRAHSGKYKVA